MTGRRAPRTVFEELLRQSDRTYEEVALDFEATARQLGERGVSISARHLRRLASGECTGTTPATRRVLQAMFDRRIDELLQPWPPDGTAGDGPRGAEPRSDTAPLEVVTVAAQRAREFGLLDQTSMTNELMEQLYDDVGQLARVCTYRPLPEVIEPLATTQNTLFRLLESRQAPDHARQLYFLAGAMSCLLARASNDLNDPYAALTQARTGFLCADRADHDGLRAMIRAWQAVITYWANQPYEAVRYAQSGIQFASAARNTSLVWLPAIEARAWGRLGNDAKAWELVQHAERLRDQVRPDDLDDIGGLCTFDRARQLFMAADALAWLPERKKLYRRHCEDAVAAFQDSTAAGWSSTFQAGSHAALAIARIGMDELEGAGEAMAWVLELAVAQRTHPVIQFVRRVRATLASSPMADHHRELAERIEVFAGASLARTSLLVGDRGSRYDGPPGQATLERRGIAGELVSAHSEPAGPCVRPLSC